MPETVYTIHALRDEPTTTDRDMAATFAHHSKVTAHTHGVDNE